ncbi:MAG TPA: outer membrane beta-barrel protein [Longimicrobiaceae bacterium]|nr:outer membrane beta-barrel protein [Longimicrobiaceae bacterium]
MTTPSTLLAALAALALALPPAARAQGCVGAPVPDGAHAVQVEAGSATYDLGEEYDGTSLGVGFRANPRGLLGYSVEYARRNVGENDTQVNVGSAALALRLPLPVSLLTVCVRGGVSAALLSQDASGTDLTNLTVPAALVVELPLPLGPGRLLVPYAAPQYLYSRTSGEVFGFDLDENDTGFGVEAGVGLRLSRLVLTGGAMFSELAPELATTAFPGQAFFVRLGVLF